LIRQAHVDVLIDLRAHASPNRLLVFARKPAPVQITYLSYPGTTGLKTMDYRLTDAVLDPSSSASFYTERSIPLTSSYWCYQPAAQLPEVSALPAEKNNFITFGCLNPFFKVAPASFALWREILSQVPNSRLLLHALMGSHRDRFRNDLGQHQINPHRLDFVGKQSYADYLATYAKIDIALDPFPFPGGATTCDALFMGVPTITLAPQGAPAVGRMGASILTHAGLTAFIAHTPEDYLRIATTCAHELPKLTALRTQLRPRLLKSPLMDPAACVKGIEVAYRQAWRAWCAARH